MKKLGAFFLVLLLVWSCGSEQSESNTAEKQTGEDIFMTHCAICHGKDGKKGFAGAKVLPESKLNLVERVELITNGKGTMMPYRGVLSPEEIQEVAKYTLTLK